MEECIDSIYIVCICVLLLLQSADSDAAKAFLQVAGGIDDIPFAITSTDSVFSEYSVEGEGVVLLKKVRNNHYFNEF